MQTTQSLDAAARYYARNDIPAPASGLSPLDEIGRAVQAGELLFREALDDLVRAELGLLPPGADFDISAIEKRISRELAAAAGRAGMRENAPPTGGMAGKLRPDIDAALAQRLGIDPTRPLTVGELSNLMNNKTTDGSEIEGKKKHSAHRSVAATFGLPTDRMPSVGAIGNVLNGRRADGAAPVTEDGKRIAPAVIASSVRKFKQAIGVSRELDATPDQIARVGV